MLWVWAFLVLLDAQAIGTGDLPGIVVLTPLVWWLRPRRLA